MGRTKSTKSALSQPPPKRPNPLLLPELTHSANPSDYTSPAPTPRCRTQATKGKAILPLSDKSLHGNLTFTSKVRKERYAEFSVRKIPPCRYIHYPTLVELGLHDAFDALLASIGWSHLTTIQCPAFIELTREFYTTFELHLPETNFTLDSPHVIHYRLMGHEFHQSITAFNLALGMVTPEFALTALYRSSRVDFDDAFHPIALWRTLSTDPIHYNPSNSKGYYLREPLWRVMHRYLACSFSGKSDTTGVCSKLELYLLWAMLNSVQVNFGYWFASQIVTALSKKRHLILGSYITHLAINLGVFDISNHSLHLACSMTPLDMHCLANMQMIEYVDGTPQLCPPGSLPRRPTVNSKRPRLATVTNSPPEDDFAARIARLEESQLKVEQSLLRLERSTENLVTNMHAFFQNSSFTPHVPPSP